MPRPASATQRVAVGYDDEIGIPLGIPTSELHVDSKPEFDVTASFETYVVGGRRVVFGGVAGLSYDDEVLPRNPYVLASVSPSTPEGRKIGLQYAHALVALSEMRAQATLQSAQRLHDELGWSFELVPSEVAAVLSEEGLAEMAATMLSGGPVPPDTFVDALLLSAAEGDATAHARLAALAETGRRLVNLSEQKRILPAARLGPAREKYSDALTRQKRMEDEGHRGTDEYNQVTEFIARKDAEHLAWCHDQREELDRRAAALREMSAKLNEMSAKLHNTEHSEKKRQGLKEIEQMRSAMFLERSRLEGEDIELESFARPSAPGLVATLTSCLQIVHETTHDIVVAENGDVLLWPRGDHEPDGFRDTLHFAVGGLVKGHVERAGPGAEVGRSIVADLDAVLKANPGALNALFTVDTRLTPPPREPLRLPAEAVTIVKYGPGEDGPAAVADAIRRRGGQVVEAGQDYAPESDRKLKALAAALGVGSNRHNASADKKYEDALGIRGPGVAAAGPDLRAGRMREIGPNGLLRLFDRGGERPYGREASVRWTGAEVKVQKVPTNTSETGRGLIIG